MNNYIIYKYTSPNNKSYIGQTNRTLEKRANHGKGYIHSSYFYAAIQKYGFENFTCEILKESLTLEEANYWEKYYIQFYASNTREKGYNIAPGGDNNCMSPEGKQKLSNRMKTNNPMQDPMIAEYVAQKRRGVPLSDIARQHIAEGHKKRVQCIETQEIFESRKDAAEAYHVSPSGIGRAINGEQKTSAGKHWRYI